MPEPPELEPCGNGCPGIGEGEQHMYLQTDRRVDELATHHFHNEDDVSLSNEHTQTNVKDCDSIVSAKDCQEPTIMAAKQTR